MKDSKETTEELLKRKDKNLFPLIQVASMVTLCQVQLEDCEKALQNEYGLDWKEAWEDVFNTLKHIQHKLDTFHTELEHKQ